MKKLLFLILLLPLCAFQVSAQIVNNGPGTFVWTDSAPTHNPGASGAKFAVDRNTFDWYEWAVPRSGPPYWILSGERIQKILGCVVPGYTPGKNLSTMVINDCDSMYHYRNNEWRHLNPGGVQSVASIADSTAFRAYGGNANILIMHDTLRGGQFAKCTACVADNYMIFEDANGNTWERINYDRILSSWWGRYGGASLQLAINYVARSQDKSLGVLHLNIPYTIKSTVTRKEGVKLIGVSTTAQLGTNLLEAPQRNVITVDLNSATGIALETEENIRGYESGGGIENLSFDVISRCSIVVNMREPYKSDINNIQIGLNSTPRLFNYGLAVKGSVVTVARRVFIQGAIDAAILGYYGNEIGDFSGGTFRIYDSYLTRSNIGIEMRSGQSFDLDNVTLENIDSIGIYTEGSFSMINCYTESCPLRTNGSGAFIRSGGDVYDIYLNNVFANAGNSCALGNCPLFDGIARRFIFANGKSNNITTAVAKIDSVQYGAITNIQLSTYYSDTTALKAHKNWQYGYNAQLSGGTLDATTNTFKGKNVIPKLADKNESLGTSGQIPTADGTGKWAWGTAPVTGITGSGANGQIAYFTGATTQTGTNSLFWDAVNTRLGVGTPVPTRNLTLFDASNSYLQVRGSNNGGIELYISNSSPNCAWDSYASRGTLDAPAATIAGNMIGQFRFFGHTGSAYRQAAGIRVRAAANSSVGGGVSTDIILSVTRAGFGGETERVWLKNRGYFSVGTNNPSGYLTVKSDDSGVPNIRLISNANDSTAIYVRSSAPELSQSAPPGSLAVVTDGRLFGKSSGDGSSGWLEYGRAFKVTATLDFPSTGAHSSSDLTITVTGAAVGDGVMVAPGLAAISAHSCYTAWVSAANTVTVRFNHYGSGGATDPESASFNVIVTKF